MPINVFEISLLSTVTHVYLPRLLYHFSGPDDVLIDYRLNVNLLQISNIQRFMEQDLGLVSDQPSRKMYYFTIILKITGSVFILSNRCYHDKPQ